MSDPKSEGDAPVRGDASYRAPREHAWEGIVVVDAGGRCVDANAAMCRLLGRVREQVVGRPLLDFVPSEDAARFAAARQAAGDLVECRLRRADGMLVPVALHAALLPDGRWQGLVHDLTDRVAARAETGRTSALLQLVAGNTPALLAYVGPDLRYQFVNANYERAIGRPRAVIVGQPVLELLDPDFAVRLRQRLEAALRGQSVRFADRLRSAAGGAGWVDGHCVPDVGPDGQVRGVVVSMQDVGELRRVQERIEEPTRLPGLVAGRLPAMIAFLDAEQRYQFANSRHAAWFGHASEALVGRTLREVIGDEAFARARPYVDDVLRGEPVRFDNRLVPAGGARRWVEVSYEPIRGDDGEVAGFIEMLRDVDGRKRREGRSRSRAAELAREVADAQAASAAHAARLAAVVETAGDAIVTIDEHGVVQQWNLAAEGMFGWSAAEAIGRDIAFMLPASHRARLCEYMARYRATGERRVLGITREIEAVRRDGSTFPIDFSVGEGGGDGRRFFTGIIRDVTERKDLQAKLAQTERLAAVGELAAGVAHEINNPINTILNSAQLIKDGDDAGPHCDVILAESERVAAIVRDLLQFARDDRNQPQPVAIADVVSRTARLVGENFKNRGIQLCVAVADDLPPVLAGPQHVQQVLLNLLVNAKDALLHASCREPAVTVTAVADANGVTLVVRDNGPGVPLELGNRVFEPFVTTKRAKGGTGLGLSISKGLVESYGGRIELVSTPGRGAELRVWLPRATEAARGEVDGS